MCDVASVSGGVECRTTRTPGGCWFRRRAPTYREQRAQAHFRPEYCEPNEFSGGVSGGAVYRYTRYAAHDSGGIHAHFRRPRLRPVPLQARMRDQQMQYQPQTQVYHAIRDILAPTTPTLRELETKNETCLYGRDTDHPIGDRLWLQEQKDWATASLLCPDQPQVSQKEIV